MELKRKGLALVIVSADDELARRGEWHSPINDIRPSRFNRKRPHSIKGRMPFAPSVEVVETMIEAKRFNR